MSPTDAEPGKFKTMRLRMAMRRISYQGKSCESSILQIFNKTKCVNLVSNVSDNADQSSFFGRAASVSVLELRHVLNHDLVKQNLVKQNLVKQNLVNQNLVNQNLAMEVV
jgi:hypothetical protein